MKKNLFLAVICMITFCGKAQMFSGGIVGGVSTSAVKIEHTGEQLNNVIQGNNIQGFEAGVFAKLMLAPLYLKPMALYDFSAGQIQNRNESSTRNSNFTMHRIETPVLLGLRIIKPLGIEGGPVYNYIVAANTNDPEVSISETSGLGYRIGATLEIRRLLVNASYTGFRTNSAEINSTSFKEPYKLIFGLGIKLGNLED